MPRPRLVPLLALAVALSVASSAGAQVYRADTPKLGALYANGRTVATSWPASGCSGSTRAARASARRAAPRLDSRLVADDGPNAWNATDQSEASMHGGVGWYRKDFRLPSSAARYSWVIRSSRSRSR